MKKYILWITGVLIFSLILILGSVRKSSAQSSDTYQIIKYAMTSGGNNSQSTNHNLDDVIGQPIHTGESQSAYQSISPGFFGGGKLTTSVEMMDNHEALVPVKYELYQNYPNPFNPETSIQFAIEEKNQVLIKVFNLLGREVAVLMDEPFQPGHYQVTFDASQLPSGIYFYHIQMGDYHAVKKMVLLE